MDFVLAFLALDRLELSCELAYDVLCKFLPLFQISMTA